MVLITVCVLLPKRWKVNRPTPKASSTWSGSVNKLLILPYLEKYASEGLVAQSIPLCVF